MQENVKHFSKYIPAETMETEMKTPKTPKDMMVRKLWKNCFFFTWKLQIDQEEEP
jgi:hypothetical protein